MSDTAMVFDTTPVPTVGKTPYDLARQVVQEKYNRDILDLTNTELLELDEVTIVRLAMDPVGFWNAWVLTGRDDNRLYEVFRDDFVGVTKVRLYQLIGNETIRDSDR